MKKKLLLAFFILLLFSPGIVSAGETLPINLLKQDIYIARGFSPEWTNRFPDDKSWKKISGNEAGRIRLSIPELGIEGFPVRKWFSLESHKAEPVTIIIPFKFEHAERQNRMYGLFFAYIGGCWELFLNGESIKNEMHLDKSGDIEYITNSRNIFIPVPTGVLRSGDNILAIRIVGDPTFVKTGIYQNWPNILSDIESIYEMHSEKLSLILICIYLLIGAYHLFLFALRPSERYNCFFGLICLFGFINQFARTSSIYYFITDTNTINRIELIFLYTLIPMMGFFIDDILFRKVKKATCIYSAFFIIFIIATAFAPMPFVYDLVQFWEKFIAMPCMGYIVIMVVIAFKKSIHEYNPRLSPDNPGILMKTLRGLVYTTSGRFLVGIIIIAACVVLDVLLKRYFYIHVNPLRFGFLIIVLGTTMNLADNFIYIHRAVESLNISLNETVSDLKTAYERISVSEEKYRMLIEGANHYICTTDLAGNLLTANNKLIREQKLDPGFVGRTNIMDLFYVPPDDNGVTRQFIHEKIMETVTEKKQVFFKAKMNSHSQKESREMSVYFEIVGTASTQEVLVKAYDAAEDALLKNLICEKQVLEMGNNLTVAEEMSNRLVRNIERYYDPNKKNILRMALREILLNSIEHGNLDVSYNSKTKALENDRYFEIIAERQNDPRFRDKKVSIEYTLTPQKVVYVIRDDGEGFDHRNMIGSALATSNEQMLGHGRGIAMAMIAFDEVTYNDKGNEVTLVKYFRDK